MGETIASGDSCIKIEQGFIAIFECQRWINTNIYEGTCQYLSTTHPDVRLGCRKMLTSTLFGLWVDQKYSSIIGIWPKSVKYRFR